MFEFLVTALLNGLAVWFGARYLQGIKVTDFTRAIIVGFVVAILNATLGGVLNFLSTPINFLTLGLFGLVIDALLLMLADYFLKGIEIKNFWYALALAAIVSIVNAVVHWIF